MAIPKITKDHLEAMHASLAGRKRSDLWEEIMDEQPELVDYALVTLYSYHADELASDQVLLTYLLIKAALEAEELEACSQ